MSSIIFSKLQPRITVLCQTSVDRSASVLKSVFTAQVQWHTLQVHHLLTHCFGCGFMLHAWLSWKRSVQLCNEDHTPIIVFASSKFGALLLLEQAKLQSLNIGWSCCHSRFCQSRMWCTCPICWEMTPVLDICPVNRVMTSHWTNCCTCSYYYVFVTYIACVCVLLVGGSSSTSQLVYTPQSRLPSVFQCIFSVWGKSWENRMIARTAGSQSFITCWRYNRDFIPTMAMVGIHTRAILPT